MNTLRIRNEPSKPLMSSFSRNIIFATSISLCKNGVTCIGSMYILFYWRLHTIVLHCTNRNSNIWCKHVQSRNFKELSYELKFLMDINDACEEYNDLDGMECITFLGLFVPNYNPKYKLFAHYSATMFNQWLLFGSTLVPIISYWVWYNLKLCHEYFILDVMFFPQYSKLKNMHVVLLMLYGCTKANLHPDL